MYIRASSNRRSDFSAASNRKRPIISAVSESVLMRFKIGISSRERMLSSESCFCGGGALAGSGGGGGGGALFCGGA